MRGDPHLTKELSAHQMLPETRADVAKENALNTRLVKSDLTLAKLNSQRNQTVSNDDTHDLGDISSGRAQS